MAGSALLFSRSRALAATTGSHIDVLIDEPIATIAPEIYGHFTEHLGGVIYDGVWVGEKSTVPNVNGIRRALVEKLKAIQAPVIRWPGGCFADSYDWKDGIGPHDKRPRRTNFWEVDPQARALHNSPQQFEPNTFGTDEFVHFCKLSGAEPYFASNLRSLPALSFDQWIEYCNSPRGATTLADIRGAAGYPDPYNVHYWGVGNESWGCGGNFTPEQYASEFRRFTTWVPGYGVDLKFVGSGPNDNDTDWTHRFFENIFGGSRPYDNRSFTRWSCHHYAWNLSRGKTRDWVEGKGDALNFDATDWYELFHEGDFTEKIITDQWAAMGQYDHERQVKLVVDEYGPWYRPGSELDPTHLLGQQITMRDAVFTAFTLDIFNRHADKVGMAACAQLINCLNSLFLAHEDKFTVTPVFHVFDMYAAHQGAKAVRAEFSSPDVRYMRDGKPASFWGLKGSASLKEKTLTMTVVNPDVAEPRETEISIRPGNVASVAATVLAEADMHAHNTFEHPDAVQPKAVTASGSGSTFHFTFPPASVTKLTITLS
jgi:alpha-L-arabinofuranosidase